MSNDMYFLPLIAKGLLRPDPEKALGEALREIERRAEDNDFGTGWRQFELFMDEVLAICHGRGVDGLLCAAIEAATAFEECSPSDIDRLLPGLSDAGAEELRREILLWQRVDQSSLILHSDRRADIETWAGDDGAFEFTDVPSGIHEILTDTDRLLWSGRLSTSQVQLIPPSSTTPLRMAASTGDGRGIPTLEVPIGDIGSVLRVYPGRKCGILRIEPATQKGRDR